jgi:hypothetical protein
MKLKSLIIGLLVTVLLMSNHMGINAQDNLNKIKILDALEKGLVDIAFEGGKDSLKITLCNLAQNPIIVLIPQGVTKFGFGGNSNAVAEVVDSEMLLAIDTQKLDSDGFSLELDKDLSIELSNQKSVTNSVEGAKLRGKIFGSTEMRVVSGKVKIWRASQGLYKVAFGSLQQSKE